jgi:hypothetical protein
MYIKRKADKAMWINPPSNLNGWQTDRERRKTDPGNARYLKLADAGLRPNETQPKTASTWVKSDDAEPRQIAHPTDAPTDKRTYLQEVYEMKTTIPIQSLLEHEILNWAIDSDFYAEAESKFPAGWSSWDRAGVLDSGQLVLDWQTPHIAMYAAFILLRLQDLYRDARDKYAETAKDLEKRIRRALKAQGTAGHEFLFKTASR